MSSRVLLVSRAQYEFGIFAYVNKVPPRIYLPFSAWLYFYVINHRFIVICYKSLPGYGDRILENKSTPQGYLP